MKKMISLAMVLVVILTTVVMAPIYAASGTGFKVLLDGVKVDFPDAQPYLTEGRVFVPVRFVTEAMGSMVSWDGNKKLVTIKKGSDVITLIIGNKEIKKNGTGIQMDVAPSITNSRTYVPLRFVSEALNAKVEWLADERIVKITSLLQGVGVLPPVGEVVPQSQVLPWYSDEVYGYKMKLVYVDYKTLNPKLEEHELVKGIEIDRMPYSLNTSFFGLNSDLTKFTDYKDNGSMNIAVITSMKTNRTYMGAGKAHDVARIKYFGVNGFYGNDKTIVIFDNPYYTGN